MPPASPTLRIGDCGFDRQPWFGSPEAVAAAQAAAYGYASRLSTETDLVIVKHAAIAAEARIAGVRWRLFPSGRSMFFVPWRACLFLRRTNRELVIVQGLVFPHWVILLRLFLGRRSRILLQHHGEFPGRGRRRWLQRLADHCVDGYLFTALGNARPWKERGIMDTRKPCFELPEASTDFVATEQGAARARTGITGRPALLWVGRLNRGKDPGTVLRACAAYCRSRPEARLYMVFPEDQLPPPLKALLEEHEALRQATCCLGRLPHRRLSDYYAAADYFLSGSHHEGSGYALIEAMACGCIPLVTDIPSFRRLTDEGRYGHLYPPGDAGALLALLRRLDPTRPQHLSRQVTAYFRQQLSFSAIARELEAICRRLAEKGHHRGG